MVVKKAELTIGETTRRIVGGKAEGAVDVFDGKQRLGRVRFEITPERDLRVVWEQRKGAEPIRSFQAWSTDVEAD